VDTKLKLDAYKRIAEEKLLLERLEMRKVKKEIKAKNSTTEKLLFCPVTILN
jgi:hypothetical protein